MASNLVQQNESEITGYMQGAGVIFQQQKVISSLILVTEHLDILIFAKLCFLLGIATIVYTGVYRRFFSPLAKYPGPWLAKISSLWALRHAYHGRWSKDVFAEHMKHGDFVRITHKEISTTHADAIRTVLHSTMDKGDWYKIWAMPDSTLSSVQSTLSSKDVSRRQRNIGPGFTLSTITQSEKRIDEVLTQMRGYLMELADTGKSVSLGDVWAWTAFDVLGEVTFSHRFGFLDARKDIGGAIASTELMMVYGVMMGYALPLNTLILDNFIVRSINRWMNLTDKMHLVRIGLKALADREKDPEGKHDMVAVWFNNLAKNNKVMRRDEVTAAAIGNIGGGSETISATVQSVVYHLLKTPHAMKLVQAELDGAQLSRIPSNKEVSNLPYLQACVKEGFRMHPAGPWNLSRVSPSPDGVTIGDEYFPPGTVISVNPWVIHHHPKFFKRPESFEPERWLNDEQRKAEEPFWIPFGGGYNRCPGRQLALLEVPKITAIMLRDFRFERVEPGKEWKWRNNFTALPHGWDCRIYKR